MISFLKISLYVCFYPALIRITEITEVTIRKIKSAKSVKVSTNIPEKIHFLKCSAEHPGRVLQGFIQMPFSITENLQAHESHHFCRPIDICSVPVPVILSLVKIHLHALKKSFYQL